MAAMPSVRFVGAMFLASGAAVPGSVLHPWNLTAPLPPVGTGQSLLNRLRISVGLVRLSRAPLQQAPTLVATLVVFAAPRSRVSVLVNTRRLSSPPSTRPLLPKRAHSLCTSCVGNSL